jgi:hypothetical protein
MVIYRSRLHANLKRNYQLMPALKWLRMLMNRIPDEDEHLILLHERNRGKPYAPPDRKLTSDGDDIISVDGRSASTGSRSPYWRHLHRARPYLAAQ